MQLPLISSGFEDVKQGDINHLVSPCLEGDP